MSDIITMMSVYWEQYIYVAPPESLVLIYMHQHI